MNASSLKPRRTAATATADTTPPQATPLYLRVVQGMLLLFAASLPFYFDIGVPEVSGDIRWMATELFAGLCATLMLAGALFYRRDTLSLRWPPMMWFGLGLALWAALSMVDALNPSRGIILIKALYAQLILMVVVYCVTTPAFGRKLLWALVLPLLITSLVGFWQFHGMNDASLHALIDANWAWLWLKPILWITDPLAGQIAAWVGWGDRNLGTVGLATSTFLQSAIPGSTFANKNLAGSWTAMMLPLALYLLLTAKRWPAQALASLLLAMGSVFLVYSRARASWLALICALMTLAALVILVPAWRKAVWRHLDISHLFWLAIPLCSLGIWGGDTSHIPGHAIDRSPAEQVESLTQSSWNEIGGRLAYNLNSLVITRDYWLNGVGLGNFYTIYPPYYNEIVVTPTNSYSVLARPQRTHTDVMQAFTEMGVAGGLFYLGLFISGLAMALRMAGRRAGALGGYLVGAGMLTLVTGLTVFLERQSMLALPGMWHWLLLLALLLALLGMLTGAYLNWRALRADDAPADDTQLLGLMAGIALLTICINALFDFPMQLPTAPAAALMLMGVIAALHVRYYPHVLTAPLPRVMPPQLKLGRAGLAALLVTTLGATGWAMYDAYLFRTSNVLLKQGMIRIYAGVTDDQTLELLQRAWDVYPYDQRIQEHIGVTYANYRGVMPISLDTRIAKMEWVLAGDPWGANHIINLSGLYLQRAVQRQATGDAQGFADDLARTERLFEDLKQNADFSHYTWGIGGTLRNMQNRPQEAMWMFRRALAIEPTYAPAQVGLQMAISASGIRPAVVKDQMFKLD